MGSRGDPAQVEEKARSHACSDIPLLFSNRAPVQVFTLGRDLNIFTVRTGTSETLEIPLDAKLDGEQLCYYGPTPDSEGNDVKMAFKVRVVFSA
jgi:hypothetical protein